MGPTESAGLPPSVQVATVVSSSSYYQPSKLPRSQDFFPHLGQREKALGTRLPSKEGWALKETKRAGSRGRKASGKSEVLPCAEPYPLTRPPEGNCIRM